MKMNLGVLDRLLLLNILPKEGNLVTLRVTRDLSRDLGFTEEELKDLNFVTNPNGGISWDTGAAAKIVKEIEIGDTMLSIVVKELKKLDKEEKLSMEILDLYEKFIPIGEE